MALSTTLPAGLKYENKMNTLCFAAGDHMKGIRAFQQKRDAEFKQ
jgi:enoyl-CoA hydratase